jgi:transcription antitermination factor NusG
MTAGGNTVNDLYLDSDLVVATQNPCWYAIRTRSRHEKMVARQLEGLQVETFLPLLSQVHRWSDRRKQVDLPLFPGYAFVRLVYSPDQRLQVIQIHGVVGFVGAQNKAIPIPDGQIDDIRTLLTNKVSFKNHRFLQAGQKVRIRGGSLDGVEGFFVAQKSERILVISVEPIHRSLSIDLEGYDVEAI